MAILSSIFETRRQGPAADGWYVSDDPSLLSMLLPSSSGVVVTEDIAMTYSAHYACVRVISETWASISLHMYKRLQPRGRMKATDHYLYKVLHEEPNPEMTAFQFTELKGVHLLNWGNFYAEIERDRNGRVKWLWPLNPRKMRMKRIDTQLWYIYRLPSGEDRKFKPGQIYHVKGLGTSGLEGLSPVGQQRAAIGLGIAQEKFASGFYKRGTHIGAIVEHEKRLGDTTKMNLRESIKKMHEGVDSAHRIMILDSGFKYHQIGLPLKDIEFLAGRKWSLEDMCRIHRLQLSKVQYLEYSSTRSNIEHQAIEFTTDTMTPWIVRDQQEIKRQLMEEKDKVNYYPEYDLNSLLRGDIKTRWFAYKQGKTLGVYSSNDIREKENENPIMTPDGNIDPAGDKYQVQNIWTDLGAEAPSLAKPISETKSKIIPIETRRRNPKQRLALRKNFLPLFKDASSRIVSKDTSNLRTGIDSNFSKRSEGNFKKWLENYYKKFPARIERDLTPLITAYGKAISEAAALEINADGPSEADIEKYAKGYVERFIQSYVRSSKGQLEDILEKVDPDRFHDALMERVDEWDEKRPDKIAGNENVTASEVFARYTFLTAGITKLIWSAGGSKPCPFCEGMDGTVVGIEEPFANDGDELNPEGAEAPMRIYGAKTHPPLHGGCVCNIVAG